MMGSHPYHPIVIFTPTVCNCSHRATARRHWDKCSPMASSTVLHIVFRFRYEFFLSTTCARSASPSVRAIGVSAPARRVEVRPARCRAARAANEGHTLEAPSARWYRSREADGVECRARHLHLEHHLIWDEARSVNQVGRTSRRRRGEPRARAKAAHHPSRLTRRCSMRARHGCNGCNGADSMDGVPVGQRAPRSRRQPQSGSCHP